MARQVPVIVLGICVLLLPLACGESPTEPQPQVQSIALTPSTVDLTVGDTARLTAEITTTGGAAKTADWSSGDSDIATVDSDGTVTGVGAGSTTVQACATADPTKCAAANVEVRAPEPDVRSVTVEPDSFSVSVGDTAFLEATVDAKDGVSTDVRWSSSDAAVATVDSSGAVVGQSTGNVTITATSEVEPSKTGSAQGSVEEASSASVTISSLNGEDPDSVQGDVSVTVQMDGGSQSVTEVELLVDDTVVASQQFTSNSDATVSQNIIESDLGFASDAFDRETGEVAFRNGKHELRAELSTASGDTGDSATATRSVTFRNQNRFTFTQLSADSDSAKDANGVLWYTGDVTATVVPVVYDSTDIERVTLGWRDALGASLADTLPAHNGAFTVIWYDAPAGDTVDGTEVSNDRSIRGAAEEDRAFVEKSVRGGGERGPSGTESDLIRVDNQAPSVTTNDLSWVNGEDSVTAAVQDIVEGDEEVGRQDTTYLLNDTAFTDATFEEADEADSVEFVVQSTDALGNTGSDTTSFGIDRTEPDFDFRSTSVGSEETFDQTNPAERFGVLPEDTLSGVTNDIETKLIRRFPGLTQLPNEAECVVGAGSDCDFTTKSVTLDTDGGTGKNGYYEYTAYTTDHAGNRTDTLTREIAIDGEAPQLGIGTPGSIEGLRDEDFPYRASDNLDLVDGSAGIIYSDVTNFEVSSGAAPEDFTFEEVDFDLELGEGFDDTLKTEDNDVVTVEGFIRRVGSVDQGTGKASGTAMVKATSFSLTVQDVAGNSPSDTTESIDQLVDTSNDAFDLASDVDTWEVTGPDTVVAALSETLEASVTTVSNDVEPFDSSRGVLFFWRDHGASEETPWKKIGQAEADRTSSTTIEYEIDFTAPVDKIGDDIDILALGVDQDEDGLIAKVREDVFVF